MAPKKRLASSNPAAAALRGGRAFQDLRASDEQLTTERLIAEAQELQHVTSGVDKRQGPATLHITSKEELALYRQKSRQDFEFHVKRSYVDFGSWIRYAAWEEAQQDFGRARSVFERCLTHHGEKTEFWRHYAEFELRNGFVEEAREVWERAVRSHPGATELWLKYILQERAAYEDDRTRELFRRWLSTKPEYFVWKLAIEFEMDRECLDRARELLAQLVVEFNEPATWEYYVTFELDECADTTRGVQVAQTALRVLGAGLSVPSTALVIVDPAHRQVGSFQQAPQPAPAASSTTEAERRGKQRALLRSVVRISLHLARAHASAAATVGDARTVYRALTAQLQQPNIAELFQPPMEDDEPTLAALQHQVFLAMASFERRQVIDDDDNGTRNTSASDLLTLAHAKDSYRQRIALGPQSNEVQGKGELLSISYFDAVAALLRILLDEEDNLRRANNGFPTPQSSAIRQEWQSVLTAAIVTAEPASLNGGSGGTATAVVEAQKCAALALFYSNALQQEPESAATTTADGQVHPRTKASQILFAALRKLPVPRAWYPSLWIAAAKARARVSTALTDNDVRAAREIFGEAIGNCPCVEVFAEYIALECAVRTQRNSVAYDRDEAIPRCRRIYQRWIELFPLEPAAWLQYSTYEGSLEALFPNAATRSDAILQKGIQVLTSAAHEETSVAARYERYRAADLLWKQRMTTAVRQQPPDVDKARRIFGELLEVVWSAYNGEFQQWSTQWKKKNTTPAAGHTSPASAAADIPHNLPHAVFGPALQRLSDAIQGRVGFELRAGGSDPAAAKDTIRRDVFKRLITEKRTAAAEAAVDRAFQDRVVLRQWFELEMQPMFYLWRNFESQHGSAESLAAVQETAEPAKKRTRLFKK